jgi:hypothetical protein
LCCEQRDWRVFLEMAKTFIKSAAVMTVFALLVGCTPAAPTMNVEQAQAFCRSKVSKPVDTRVQLGIGIGSGGKVRTNTGIEVGVNVDSLMAPEKTYEKCVMKNAGVPPTAPYSPQS